jgi:hypothetical protein
VAVFGDDPSRMYYVITSSITSSDNISRMYYVCLPYDMSAVLPVRVVSVKPLLEICRMLRHGCADEDVAVCRCTGLVRGRRRRQVL